MSLTLSRDPGDNGDVVEGEAVAKEMGNEDEGLNLSQATRDCARITENGRDLPIFDENMRELSIMDENRRVVGK